ncbi:beta-propeller domain-containing protein [Methanothermococcus sp. SCGC AD-155-C09]|nr:beta-propeller domain-containing protein [Methanothermococcus sp. SCGC AD-155-C09]
MKNNLTAIGIFILIFLISTSGCIQGGTIGNGNNMDNTTSSTNIIQGSTTGNGNNMDNTTSSTNIKEFKVVPATPETLKEFLNSLEDNYAYYGPYLGYRSGVKSPLSPTEETVMKDAVVSSTDVMDSEITIDRYSKTNVQVEGIDEGDILKTDGNYIYYSPEHQTIRYSPHSKYYLSKRSTYIIDALPPESAKIISNISKGGILYLYNNTLTIIDRPNGKILNYDISNPKNPKINWKMDINGSYTDSRLYNGKLYLVVSKYDENNIPFPIVWNGIKMDYNRYYLPMIPGHMFHNFDVTYIISSIEVEDGNINNTLAIVGSYNTEVYMSENNIYLAYYLQSNRDKLFMNFIKENLNKYFPEDRINLIKNILNSPYFSDEAKYMEVMRVLNNYLRTLPREESLNLMNTINKDYEYYIEENWEDLEKTGIVGIDLDSFEVKSGSVPGRLINRYSMDEYNNYLRVATTIGNYWEYRDKSTNNIYILDDNLEIVGKLTGIAKGERIYATRFMGNIAYMITYRETDPLFVINLTDPSNPEILGKLKIPGYSTYLHPIGDNKLIGIGKDDDGKLKVSLFDVENVSNPLEIDKYILPEYWSPALYNPHAFLWDKDNRILIIPANNHGYVFKIENNKITLKMDDKHKTRVLRSLYINNYLYILSDNEIHIINMDNWELINKIELQGEC